MARLKACIIAVGSELLTPFRLDTNSLAITERVNAVGFDVRRKVVVGDDVEEVIEVFKGALAWADLIVLTGGLGPTADDITREAVAGALQLPLEENAAVVERIRARFARRGMTMPEINRRQAMVPRGFTIIENPNGTAPGLWVRHRRADVVLLPGPPRELTAMLDAVIAERLAGRGEGAGLFRRVVKITGWSESHVDELAQPVYSRWTSQAVPIDTTILAVLGQIELRLTALAAERASAETALDAAVAQLRALLGDAIYSVDGRGLEAVVGGLLRERHLTIAVAESCTGGLLTSRLTDVPGSSDYVERGGVCYSNRAKIEWLGVPEALIAEHGAVSEPVAQAMAAGIRAHAGVDVGVAVTGIAGPGGGTPQKPVGTVAIAVEAGRLARARTFRFVGDREMVKFQATQAALNQVRLLLTT